VIRIVRWAAVLASAVVGAGSAGARPAPDGLLARYDFTATPAERWLLPRELNEISGLAIDKSGRVFAHGDERAVVYQLDPATKRVVKRFSFGRRAVHGDFESIAFAGDRLVLATSDGVLYLGSEGRDGEAVPYTVQATGVGAQCEVEGLAWEPADQTLLLACKTPRIKALHRRITVFGWSLERRALAATPRILAPLSRVTRALGETGFHPSELLRDPGTGHFLLLAGPQRAIAELTPDGQVVRVSRLRPALHRQPEGLAITADGALLVADEASGKRATLTVYSRSR
jgi:uncharacterized protein YjiK